MVLNSPILAENLTPILGWSFSNLQWDKLPYFVLDGLCNGTICALIALGYTLVYGIIKLINFAHGEFLMVGGYAGFFFYTIPFMQTLPPWLAIPILLVISGAAGVAIAVTTERVAYRPIRGGDRLIALLTAIGVSFFLQNVFKFVRGGNNLAFPDDSPVGKVFAHSITHLGQFELGIKTVKFGFIVLTLILMVWLWWLVSRTRFGKAMRATSQDLEAARLMGINVDRVIMMTFALGGFFAGITGMLMGAIYQVNPMMGFMPGLVAFVAAVVGGIGSIPGAVVGGLLVGLLPSLAIWAGVDSAYKDIACFSLLIVVLVFRPQGILGRITREKV